ncbi:MAG: iron-sulfur cluster assembly protein, partial [Actinomycetota bacterium]|nr:iron-sulfur cluster assembly protein [Actinomycetota bacterium]
MVTARQSRARQIAADTPDPEIPQLTLADLGILRLVAVDSGRVRVVLTPTYTGCPAIQTMRQDVARRLGRAGYADVRVDLALSPPWSSDWITAEGRRKLAAGG